jgi:hypothetical protein
LVLTLLVTAVALAALGAIIAALSGRDAWRSILWTFIIGGGVLVVLNVVGSGADRPLADYRTGFAFGVSVQDATTSAGWLIVGLVLVGLGAGGLFA